MHPRKLIFLDFDGVLNSHAWFRERALHIPDGTREMREDRDICPANIAELNKIVAATGAEVVVSSAWRVGRTVEELRSILKRNGFQGSVIDKTPRLPPKEDDPRAMVQRGDEIQAWIDANCQSQDILFVILDDDSDMAHLREHLVKTSMFLGGLCEQHTKEAISKLGKKCGVNVTKD